MFQTISKLLYRNSITRLVFGRSWNNSYSSTPSATHLQVKKSVYNPSIKPWSTSVYEDHSKHIDLNCSPFSPSHILNVQNNLLYSPKQILDLPLQGVFHLPTNCSISKVDIVTPENIIDAPPANGIVEKRAARLIVIRRRKMKKHKLRKLRKKMKFEWAKVRQRREMRKEKAFQAELIMQVKEGEAFDASRYVAEKLRQAQEKRIPKTWKGKRLPEFIIKQKLGIKD